MIKIDDVKKDVDAGLEVALKAFIKTRVMNLRAEMEKSNRRIAEVENRAAKLDREYRELDYDKLKEEFLKFDHMRDSSPSEDYYRGK